LSDSIVQAVMEADGVDPQVLEMQLRMIIANQLPAVPRTDQSGSRGSRAAAP
jgi:hypothetical protein